MRAIILILIITSIVSNKLISQVEIIMKDGEKIRGVIEEQTIQKIKIKKLKDNSVHSIDKLFIDEIKPLFTSVSTVNDETYEGVIIRFDSLKIILNTYDEKEIEIDRKQIRHSEIVDYYSIQSYPVIGFTTGYPKFFQLVGDYQFRYIGLRIDCGLPVYDKDFWGIKSNFLINIFKRKNIDCNLDLSFGYIHYPPSKETTSFFWFKHEWKYLGLSADINIRNFFVELGITNNLDDWGELFPLFQFGYVYKFVY
ncbi:MAG: hypothetical protein EPN82_09335 [Bacteroidetes bacterium]|nr:MAG: hypothetical protein EPN82_09335 [Bacteroidota bacterium]